MGVFSDWQPIYEAHGIPTFPVRVAGGDKKPAISGYLRVSGARAVGWSASSLANSFGFALKRARITILDVDTPDERVLADALDRHGRTPLLVQTGSGDWQAWYRNGGEPRRVRPWAGKPIDILGDGFRSRRRREACEAGTGSSTARSTIWSDCRRCGASRAFAPPSCRSDASRRATGTTACFGTAWAKHRGAPASASCWSVRWPIRKWCFLAAASLRGRAHRKSIWAMTERGNNWVGSRGLAWDCQWSLPGARRAQYRPAYR